MGSTFPKTWATVSEKKKGFFFSSGFTVYFFTLFVGSEIKISLDQIEGGGDRVRFPAF